MLGEETTRQIKKFKNSCFPNKPLRVDVAVRIISFTGGNKISNLHCLSRDLIIHKNMLFALLTMLEFGRKYPFKKGNELHLIVTLHHKMSLTASKGTSPVQFSWSPSYLMGSSSLVSSSANLDTSSGDQVQVKES